jgi:hypothetical protein
MPMRMQFQSACIDLNQRALGERRVGVFAGTAAPSG